METPNFILPGEQGWFLIKIQGDQGLTGYDLDVEINPVGGATGTLSANAALTNYYPSQNLISQGGGTGFHPSLSSITSLQPENSGVLIKAVNQALTPTLPPIPDVNDVLAQVYLDASLDAYGQFEISLGDQTDLFIDGTQDEEFTSAIVTITVPEPGYLGILSGLAVLALRRTRQAA